MLKFMRFQVNANQTRHRQPSASAVSYSLVQIHRLGALQIRNAFTQARIVPRTQVTPRIPNKMIQGARAFTPLGDDVASNRTASQPPKRPMKRMHTKRTPSRSLQSSGLRSS